MGWVGMAAPAAARRSIGLVAAVGLAVCGVAAGTKSRPASADPVGTLATANPSPSASALRDMVITAPQGVTTLTTGPGLTTPGIYVLVQPDAAGNLEVVERLRFAVGVTSLRLAPPKPTEAKGLEGVKPVIVGLQAAAGDAPAPAPWTGPVRSAVTLPLPTAVTKIDLRYRLEAATVRSQPSTLGRGLAALPPIAAVGLGSVPVVIEVVGSGVRNIVCPQLQAEDQLCGRHTGQVWTTTALTARQSSVIAQLDLAQPGGS